MARLYLDTNVFIRAFEAGPDLAGPARLLFTELEQRPGRAITSELTIAELLAPVKLEGSMAVADKLTLYDAFFARGSIELAPVSRDVLRQTALLRQDFSQKLPDAIHIVTALQTGCLHLMSSDKDAKRLLPSMIRLLPDAAGVAHALQVFGG